MKLTIDSICLISSILDKIKIDDKFINDMFLIGKEAKGKEAQDRLFKDLCASFVSGQ